ncbi:MAG TPA: alpha/beta fold hydrolase [Gaiellaceae bacterium]|nr:alpha/beta fold hydrolase [Gaiellaceae bacterium]
MRHLVPVLAVLALVGCGGSSHDLASNGAPSLASTCGTLPAGLSASTYFLKTDDGVRIYAAAAGDGSSALVLVHESGGAGLCGWLPTMRWLRRNGVRAVAVNLRGYPPSGTPSLASYHHYAQDIQAAVDAAHTLGAKNVFVMGASLGGAATVAEAPKLRGVAGVISLSGELELPTSELDAIGAAPKITVPFLFVGSEADGYVPASEARRLTRAVGSKDKQLHIFASGYHGWDLLDVAPYRARVKALILRWLTQRPR